MRCPKIWQKAYFFTVRKPTVFPGTFSKFHTPLCKCLLHSELCELPDKSDKVQSTFNLFINAQVLKEGKFIQGLFSCCIVHGEFMANHKMPWNAHLTPFKAILKPGRYKWASNLITS